MHDDDREIMSNDDRLIYMANQIARNMAAMGNEGAATDMVENHIRKFWDPEMRRRIGILATERPGALSPIAATVIQRISAA